MEPDQPRPVPHPPPSLGMHLCHCVVYPHPKNVCKYKKLAKFSEIIFYISRMWQRVWRTHFCQQCFCQSWNSMFSLFLQTWNSQHFLLKFCKATNASQSQPRLIFVSTIGAYLIGPVQNFTLRFGPWLRFNQRAVF